MFVQVLVPGGSDGNGTHASYATSLLYDPSLGTFGSPAAFSDGFGRQSHTATLLLDGRVLVTGGENYRAPQGGQGAARDVTNLCQLYDPAMNSWSAGAVPRGAPHCGCLHALPVCHGKQSSLPGRALACQRECS
jgi:hypothetical protein